MVQHVSVSYHGGPVGIQQRSFPAWNDALQSREKLPHGAEKRAIALLLQNVYCLIRQSNACLLKRLEAGIEVYKGEFEAKRRRESFEDASSSRYDFAALQVSAILQEAQWLIVITYAIPGYQPYTKSSGSHYESLIVTTKSLES